MSDMGYAIVASVIGYGIIGGYFVWLQKRAKTLRAKEQ
jgi:hypothetical protein